MDEKLERAFESLDEKKDALERNMSPAAYKMWKSNVLTTEQREAIKRLPWSSIEKERTKIDYKKAQELLNSQHHGMNETKTKILQLLAVRERTGKSGKGILLTGPAGTGKTTICKIIADVLNEPFYKVPLQGTTAQWELLGSNPTWKAANQGYIADAIQRSGSFSAVICLDEVDKMEKNERTPQMALLSLFDSTNTAFIDQFLAIPLDLSNVTFILTANDINEVNPILRDRLDVIHIQGYTKKEKYFILKNYIIPKLYPKYKVEKSEIVFHESAINLICESCTEPGVRDVEKLADNIFRRAIYMLALGAKTIPVNDGFVKTELPTKPTTVTREIGFRI